MIFPAKGWFFHPKGVVASMIIREFAFNSRPSGAIAMSILLPLQSLMISTPRSGSHLATIAQTTFLHVSDVHMIIHDDCQPIHLHRAGTLGSD